MTLPTWISRLLRTRWFRNLAANRLSWCASSRAWIRGASIILSGGCWLRSALCDEPVRILGPASCASATCHGGIPGRGPAWTSSVRVWESYDRHAGAGMVLWNDQSRRMVERLDPRARNDEQAFLEMLRNRCVSCHATVAEQPDAESLAALLSHGVSCEACHGPASSWIERHVDASFRGPSRFVDAPGMRDNDAWLRRVKGCARCHVGSRTADGVVRDMNHDLIAAGHPALRFEPLLFAERMPLHWNPQHRFDAVTKSPGRLQVFVSGRCMLLAMSARLANERLADAEALPPETPPDPEFADYDCLSCHRWLSAARAEVPASRGAPDWNPWSVAGAFPQVKAQEVLRLQAEAPDSILSQRHQWLAELADDAEQAAAQAFENATPVLLQSLLSDPAAKTDVHHAMVWYLELQAGWRDPEIRKAVPASQLGAVDQQLSAMGKLVLRVGTPGEALLNPITEFDEDVFQKQRQELIQLLKSVPEEMKR